MSEKPWSALLIALSCLVLRLSQARAEESDTSAFDPMDFQLRAQAQEKSLLDAGQLQTLDSLKTKLRANPASAPIPLSLPSITPLDPPDLHDKLLASTLVMGLYFEDSETHQMNFFCGGGFAVAPDGIVSTCAHLLVIHPENHMGKAYPVAIDASGKVYPIDQVIAFDPRADTALVHVAGGNFPPLALGDHIRAGENIYCLSHPGENMFIFTAGLISRVEKMTDHGRSLRFLDVSCDYSPGSSGCPITDSAGNVVAQVDKIYPQLQATQGGAGAAEATVYNLHLATAANEIAQLAKSPGGAPSPLAEADLKNASPSSSAPAQPYMKDPFAVHTRFDLVLAPKDLPLDQRAKSFDELYQRANNTTNHVQVWARSNAPTDTTSPNYIPNGFSGVTGYYRIPGTPGPMTLQNTVARAVDFKISFHDRKASQVQAHIDVNDTRATPQAADNTFGVDTTLTKDTFTLVKLGAPQGNQQAWLAVSVDGFSSPTPPAVPALGKLPPDNKSGFIFTAADGRQVDTTKMRGKVILVDFWATWCGPCVAALPRIEELYNKFHPQGFEVIGINLDSNRALLDTFLHDHPHPWPQSVSAPIGQNPLADRFDIQGIPFFLLIDKAGVATVIEARSPDTEALIDSRLKEKG